MNLNGSKLMDPKKIEEEVKHTMQSLDGIKKAKTDPYFFARLESRIENKQLDQASLWHNLWTEPKYVVGSLAVILLILVNIYSITATDSFVTSATDDQEIATAIAEEYLMDVPLLYNE